MLVGPNTYLQGVWKTRDRIRIQTPLSRAGLMVSIRSPLSKKNWDPGCHPFLKGHIKRILRVCSFDVCIEGVGVMN